MNGEEVRVSPTGKKLGARICAEFGPDEADYIYAEAERRGMTLAAYVTWAAMQHVGETLLTITAS